MDWRGNGGENLVIFKSEEGEMATDWEAEIWREEMIIVFSLPPDLTGA